MENLKQVVFIQVNKINRSLVELHLNKHKHKNVNNNLYLTLNKNVKKIYNKSPKML
jgi:hypothetical protein